MVDLTVDLTSPLGRTTPPLRRTTPPLNEIVDLTDPGNESSSVVFLDSGKIYHLFYLKQYSAKGSCWPIGYTRTNNKWELPVRICEKFNFTGYEESEMAEENANQVHIQPLVSCSCERQVFLELNQLCHKGSQNMLQSNSKLNWPNTFPSP